MPQASEELRAMFPGSDQEALEVIDKNFIVPRGFIIRPRVSGYEPTERENFAIDYLFHEWDFGYSPKTIEEAADEISSK